MASEGGRTPRLPRWTRQEILVLIQGKRVAESKVRRVRTAETAVVEPKWAAVSSYCRRHGVNRGPVQCRKRWSNLSGDFKKIKECGDSFWSMRNDLRRERKLPGFFDKEVFDIMAGPAAASESPPPPPLLLFDSRRSDDEGIFSDFDKDDEKAAQPPTPSPLLSAGGDGGGGAAAADSPAPAMEEEEERRKGKGKRKRTAEEEGERESDESERKRVVDVLERNSNALTAHLEAQKAHFEVSQAQSSSLLSVLNKLADALLRISDKL